MIQALHIPEYTHQVVRKGEQLWIYDIVRKKYVLLQPEEWVRQQFIRWLIEEHEYSKNLMQVERGLRYQKKQKRTDLLVYNKSGQLFMLVECKAMSVDISEKTLGQAALYNRVLGAKYIALTNGICCAVACVEQEKLLFLDKIPVLEDPIPQRY